MTDLEMLHQAFDLLERSGFTTRRGEACCNSCTLASIPEGEEPYAYWHEQNEDQLDAAGDIADGEFCIGYGPDAAAAERIRLALEAVGFTAEWSGDSSKKVCVTGRRSSARAERVLA